MPLMSLLLVFLLGGCQIVQGIREIRAEDTAVRDCETRSVFYADQDGDGLGDEQRPWLACGLPEGAAEQPGDCDDQDPTRGLSCDTGSVDDTGEAG